MKVVINKCFGGFSLSPMAVKLLAKRKGKECYFFKSTIEGGEFTPLAEMPSNSTYDWVAFSIPDPEKRVVSSKSFYDMSLPERQAYNENYSQYGLTSRPEGRADPDLVAVVELLGAQANGPCAELAVVDIPDGIKWEIDDYDGIERVHEVHRSWA